MLLLTVAASAVAGRSRSSSLPKSTGSSIPSPSEYLRRVLDQRGRAGTPPWWSSPCGRPADCVDSTRDINNAIIGAKTPVAVWVGPSGNRAASAGFLITMAADVAAMAPGTHIGAAHPVAGGGERMDDTMAKKMTSDIASYARTLATQRRRNVALVDQAVTESRSFTEQEALNASRRSSTSLPRSCRTSSASSTAGPSPVRRPGADASHRRRGVRDGSR